jgi:hypothetical protein
MAKHHPCNRCVSTSRVTCRPELAPDFVLTHAVEVVGYGDLADQEAETARVTPVTSKRRTSR